MKSLILLILLIMAMVASVQTAAAGIVYSGDSWDVMSETGSMAADITMNDTYFWVVGYIHTDVYQYYANGTYTGTSWDTAVSGNSGPFGITMNSSYFWITDNVDDEVYQYYANGTYTGTSFDTAASGNSGPRGITMNDSYFFIVDTSGKKVYLYHLNGTYMGTSWSTGTYIPVAITMDNNYFYITSQSNNNVYQYHLNGTHTNTTFDSSATGTPMTIGIIKNDTYIYLSNGVGGIYQYFNNDLPTTSSLQTESQTNPTNIHTNISAPYFNWTYTDNHTQHSWEIQVGTAQGLSDMWASGQLSGTDTYDTYAGSTLARDTTYHIRVKTNDSYEDSEWVNGTFKLDSNTSLVTVQSTKIGTTWASTVSTDVLGSSWSAARLTGAEWNHEYPVSAWTVFYGLIVLAAISVILTIVITSFKFDVIEPMHVIVISVIMFVVIVIFAIAPIVGDIIYGVNTNATDDYNTGTLTLASTSPGDTVSIGSETYIFTNESGGYKIDIGAGKNASVSAALLIAEINANSTLVTAA